MACGSAISLCPVVIPSLLHLTPVSQDLFDSALDRPSSIPFPLQGPYLCFLTNIIPELYSQSLESSWRSLWGTIVQPATQGDPKLTSIWIL